MSSLRAHISIDATPDRVTGLPGPEAPIEGQNDVFALTIAWSLHEPERVGEVLLFDEPHPRLVGRGGPRADDVAPRARFSRQRPSGLEERPSLTGSTLSRRHVHLTPTADGLQAMRLGKGSLTIDGEALDAGLVLPGGTLLLSNELLLVCERRPARLPPVGIPELLFPFGDPDPAGLTGETPAAWKLRDQARMVAGSGSPLLIQGAAGVGKEFIARAVHRFSAWRERPWLMVGGATLTRADLEQIAAREDGPLVVIDELADVPAEVQSVLARTLTLTLSRPQPRARFIALTREDSSPGREEARPAGITGPLSRVRPDLLSRFVLRLRVPTLEERRADIPLLVRAILLEVAQEQPEVTRRFFVDAEGRERARPRIAPRLVDLLLRQTWKANVRELTAALWLSMTTAQSAYLDTTPEVLAQLRDGTEHYIDPAALDEATVRQALEASNGRVVVAARLLGLKNRWVLYRVLEKLDIRL